MVHRDASPHHYTGSTPAIDLSDAAWSITFTTSPPDSFSAIGVVNTETALIREKDTAPLSLCPSQTLLTPLESGLTTLWCHDIPPKGPSGIELSFHKAAPDSGAADSGIDPPWCLSCRTTCSSETITQVLQTDVVILLWCRYSLAPRTLSVVH